MSDAHVPSVDEVASVEAKLRAFYEDLPDAEQAVMEALLLQAFGEVQGFAALPSLLDLGWTFRPGSPGFNSPSGGKVYEPAPKDVYEPRNHLSQ